MKKKPEKTKSGADLDNEIGALQDIIQILEPLAKEDRTRLLRTVAEFFSIRL